MLLLIQILLLTTSVMLTIVRPSHSTQWKSYALFWTEKHHSSSSWRWRHIH